jgi:protein SCO1
MPTEQPIATNKLIVFLVFICAAIMTSVFVYHMNHKAPGIISSEQNSVVFAAARDIKPVELFTANHEKLPKTFFFHHWTLVFFGFTHCSSICPTTLDKLNRVYTELQPTHPALQVLFISLDPERDTPQSIQQYVNSYNSHFIGATGSLQELRKLQSQLGIFSLRDNTSANKKDYQLQHTTSILLIDPEGKWAGMFNSDASLTELSALVQKQIKLLAQHHVYEAH